MGYYIVEVSFNIRKKTSVTKIQDAITDKAYSLQCLYHYIDYDFSGYGRVINRSHCLLTFHFSNYDIEETKSFIQYIKGLEQIYIESIYHDSILYASPKYQKNMTHDAIKNYKRKRKERSYSDEDKFVLNMKDK